MIDLKELEAAARDVKERTNAIETKCSVTVSISSDGNMSIWYTANSGYITDPKGCLCSGKTLVEAVEDVVMETKHKLSTELERAREKVRQLEKLQAA